MTIKWNKIKLTKSNLTEYFYYFFMIAVTIVILLSGTLYTIYTSTMEDEIIHSNNTILEQIKNSQETLLTEVESSIANIALDNSISSFEDVYDTRDSLLIRMVLDRLNSYTMRDSYIDSISICFLKSGRVLGTDVGFVSYKNHYDSELINNLSSYNIIKRSVFTRDMPQRDGCPDIKVLTFVDTIPLNAVNSPSAFIIVNINAKYLQNTLDYIDVRDGSNIIVTDQTGTIFTEKKDSKTFGINDLELIRDSPNLQNSYTIKKVSGKKFLISTVTSSKYGLRYIYVVPLSKITSRVLYLGRLTIIMCTIILIMSFLASLILSKRIYSPIRGIMRLLTENTGLGDDSIEMYKIKETKVIEKGINNLVDTNKDLKKKYKDLETILAEYNVYQRNRFLQDIICGERDIDKAVQERLCYYNIEIDSEGYISIILLSIDNYYEFIREFSEKQKNMLDIYLNENVTDLVLKDCKGFISELKNNTKAIVLNPGADLTMEDAMSKVNSYTKQIAELANINSKYSFTLGISRIHKGLENLNKCYSESYYALNYRLILGYSQIIRYEDIKVQNDCAVLYPYQIENKIFSNLKKGDLKSTLDSLQEFTSYFYNNSIENIETVRYCFQQLLSASLKILYEIDRNVYSEFFSDGNVYTAMESRETMQGMSDYIKNIYESTIKYINHQKNKKNNEFLNSLTNYIANNLHTDLSIERLAEQYFMSASYLRKIFKEETSQPIKEYIDKERMKKAKELLENPRIKIGDIAGKIGYISVTSFNRAFKQETGKTPSEYREAVILKQ